MQTFILKLRKMKGDNIMMDIKLLILKAECYDNNLSIEEYDKYIKLAITSYSDPFTDMIMFKVHRFIDNDWKVIDTFDTFENAQFCFDGLFTDMMTEGVIL